MADIKEYLDLMKRVNELENQLIHRIREIAQIRKVDLYEEVYEFDIETSDQGKEFFVLTTEYQPPNTCYDVEYIHISVSFTDIVKSDSELIIEYDEKILAGKIKRQEIADLHETLKKERELNQIENVAKKEMAIYEKIKKQKEDGNDKTNECVS